MSGTPEILEADCVTPSGESVAGELTSVHSRLSWKFRAALYGVLASMAITASVAYAAPDLIQPVVDSLPGEWFFAFQSSGGVPSSGAC